MNDPANPAIDAAAAAPRAVARKPRELYFRHARPVRVMHWINVVAITLMFMSGLCIFNAHPALYWGDSS
jgi:Ni,Fe-hydrogenase I cytochrome b subunit